jgi:hypothetical protein
MLDPSRDPRDSKRIWEYCKSYANKFNNLSEMNKFFESHKLLNLIQKDINILDSLG